MQQHQCTTDMRNIITNQKKERDLLLSHPYLSRTTKYDVAEILQSKQIKLITGPRRAGKSTEGLLMLKGTKFAYLNFDDAQLLNNWDEDLVMETLAMVYAGYEYLLLDEVQNLPEWDLWVSKLYRQGINMVVTGSNAKMLSSEMATLLTGRYIQIEMLPFSLQEFLGWNRVMSGHADSENQLSQTVLIDDYLRLGGYPETIESRTLTRNYLSTLFDSIIWKDVAKRHNIRNINDLNDLAMYLLSNFCNAFSANELAEQLGLASVATTKKFMTYLAEPYLFFYLSRYNNKLKVMKKAPQKVYVVDNGFVSAKAFSLSENLGRLLENQVFVELLRRGYDTDRSLFYYRSRNDKEVDFVTRRGPHVESLIQVCYDLTSERTLKREIESMIECAGELNCRNLVIVTMSDERTIEKDGYEIQVVPVGKF